MRLLLDIGNSAVKCAVVEQGCITVLPSLPHLTVAACGQLCAQYGVNQVVACAVGSVPCGFQEQMKAQGLDLLWLNASTQLPIVNAYATPATLGMDRLAAVIGAFALQPGHNCLVVDAGTAITYDVLLASGTYVGGNIAPGLQMRLRALHDYTNALPLVALRDTDYWIGNSTESALVNGVVRGVVAEIEAYRQHLLEQEGAISVFLTGGDANYLRKKLKSGIFAEPNLVFVGLNKIADFHA